MTDKSGMLKWEESGSIGVIKILGNAGNAGNTITRADFADPEVVGQWISQDSIRGVIVSGEGNHFSAGADFDVMQSYNWEDEDFVDKIMRGVRVLDLLENLDKPVIASIDGVCLGGGLEIALACHIRYCSKRAIFGMPEVSHGLMPIFGGVTRFANVVGRSKAIEFLLKGETYNAEIACKIGIVNKVVEEKSAFDFSMEVINLMITRKRLAVSCVMKQINGTMNSDRDKAITEGAKIFARLASGKFESNNKGN